MKIQDIIQSIQNKQIRVSDHAKDEAKEDSLLLSEILYSVYHGEIIEDYPTDKPYPSCLIYGMSKDRRHIHSVWAYNSENQKAVLITVYIPDPKRWNNWRERIKNEIPE